MAKIFMVPNPTGTGHNMRMYSIACDLVKEKEVNVTVVLSSLQDTFTDLFNGIGVKVIDFNPEKVVNHTKKSHLEKNLNWETMIGGYFSKTFFNGSKILKYMNLFLENKPDVVVSDYNINASIAACLLRIKHVFVTERFNFTLVDVSNDLLEAGEFNVNKNELDEARNSMNALFQWLGDNTSLMLTDKPYVKDMDEGSIIEKYFQEEKIQFVGPMIRPIDQNEDPSFLFELGVKKDAYPLIVATVSGTTMFKENKEKLVSLYTKLFEDLKKDFPKVQMVLLAKEDVSVPKGMLSIPYISNWIPLLKKCDLLLSHPGWITVTEVSALKVPAIFCLSSYKEYHEAEAFERLNKLGYETNYGFDSDVFYKKAYKLINNKESLIKSYQNAYKDHSGSMQAAHLITEIACEGSKKVLN